MSPDRSSGRKHQQGQKSPRRKAPMKSGIRALHLHAPCRGAAAESTGGNPRLGISLPMEDYFRVSATLRGLTKNSPLDVALRRTNEHGSLPWITSRALSPQTLPFRPTDCIRETRLFCVKGILHFITKSKIHVYSPSSRVCGGLGACRGVGCSVVPLRLIAATHIPCGRCGDWAKPRSAAPFNERGLRGL